MYLSYSEPGTGSEAGRAGTAVARGRLVGAELQSLQVIYRQVPKVSGNGHFGSRLAFAPDGNLFVSLGERQLGSPAQDLATTLGKVVRIRPVDGSLPPDNPTLGPGSHPRRSGATVTETRRAWPSIRTPATCGSPSMAPRAVTS